MLWNGWQETAGLLQIKQIILRSRQTAQDEEATNGDYANIWEIKDYTKDYSKIKCSAMVVQGLNDYNVTTRQADLMMRAFDKAGIPVK